MMNLEKGLRVGVRLLVNPDRVRFMIGWPTDQLAEFLPTI